MSTQAGKIRIGISGWRYEPWRGVFYPDNLPQRDELKYAASHFSAIELNGSFYSLQRPESYAQWYADTPPDFVFAVKGGRFITHMLKLKEVEVPLANFFASGVFNLREKLGPVLWQLPPQLKYDRSRLEPFLALLPQDTNAALRLARRRGPRMKGRCRLAIDANRPTRHALEIRHASFLDPAFIELLRAYRVGLVVAETAGLFPLIHDLTADFVYLRLHGDKELYKSGYSDAALDRWAERIRAWSLGEEPSDVTKASPQTNHRAMKGRDVYCFFDNTDAKLRAPQDARTLMRKLGLTPLTSPSTITGRPDEAARNTSANPPRRPRAVTAST